MDLSTAILYTDDTISTAIVRLALAHKGLNPILKDKPQTDRLKYQGPILETQDLVLFDPLIILEYLDDRFPVPCLIPPDITQRARTRLLARLFISDLILPITNNEDIDPQDLRDFMDHINAGTTTTPYMFSKRLSMIDCIVAPTLRFLGDNQRVNLPDGIKEYVETAFNTQGFDRTPVDYDLATATL